MTNDGYIILVAVLVAANCGILGVFLILRRMAMLGDAISHAVLPGIALAYIFSGGIQSNWMIIGAMLLGLLTVFSIEWLSKKVKLNNDASIGITFTSLFAIGVVLISTQAGNIDLDLDCVLYGDLAFVPFDTIIIGDQDLGPKALWWLGSTLAIILCMVCVGYRGFYITTFDPLYASGLGILTAGWHYALMTAVSLSAVTSFNAVGAILVVAFLTVPPASAYLISRNLPVMIGLSVLIGMSSAVLGFYLSTWWAASIAASMAVGAGIHFALIWIYTLIRKNKLLWFKPILPSSGQSVV